MQRSAPSSQAVAGGLLLAALAPAVAAVGFGIWSTPGALQQAVVLAATTKLSEAVELAPPLLHGPGLVLPALLVGALVAAVAARAPRVAGGVEIAALAVGAVGAAGLFAVGAGLDRRLFWAGLVVAAIGGRRAWGESADADVPAWVRGGAVAGALCLAGVAGLTLLEGPSMHSPAFRLRDVWMAWPGRSPWTSGGLWLGLGAVSCVAAAVPRLRPGRAGVVAAGVATLLCLRPLPSPLDLAGGLSVAGLLLIACIAGPAAARWIRDSLRSGPWAALDPRRLGLAAVPVVAWAGVCALRGLTVFMWTVPAGLPDGVEQLVARQDLFSLASDGADGVLWTDRERDLLGHWTPDGERTWEIWDPGGVGVEEVGPPVGGTAWVSVVGDDSSGVVAVDLDGAQGAYVTMPGCWVSDWLPAPDGRVLIPCESDPVARWFDPVAGHRAGVLPLAHEVETGVFGGGGDRLYAVGLWHTPSVIAYGLPSGDVLARRTVGPFNWALALDGDRLWVSRFFEGGALVLDADDLEVQQRVPLAFGVRAMIHEPVRDRIWAAAAYSGRLFSVAEDDPTDVREYALCGQARDLAADGDGRVFVATDCGLFSVDESP